MADRRTAFMRRYLTPDAGAHYRSLLVRSRYCLVMRGIALRRSGNAKGF
jgi:hypothetical protein